MAAITDSDDDYTWDKEIVQYRRAAGDYSDTSEEDMTSDLDNDYLINNAPPHRGWQIILTTYRRRRRGAKVKLIKYQLLMHEAIDAEDENEQQNLNAKTEWATETYHQYDRAITFTKHLLKGRVMTPMSPDKSVTRAFHTMFRRANQGFYITNPALQRYYAMS